MILFDTNVLLEIATANPVWQAFLKYRRSGDTKTSPLPDFNIGAQAETEQWTLVTRDPARYRTYFPGVSLIAPP